MSADPQDPRSAYAKSGVNVAAGDELVERIKPFAAGTARLGTLGALGGFAGLFDPAAAGHPDSLLVASTDGVGTKLRLAIDLNQHDTVGIDLVAMCVNDLLAQGAEPLFFLDYFATGVLDTAVAAAVVEGIATGCRDANCALLGGETAEMPGHYQPGDYDLAGFVLGAVRRDAVRPQLAHMREGDVLLGLASSGAHSNGYSLIRKLARERSWDLAMPFQGETLGAALMRPTRIYVKPVLEALKTHQNAIRGLAHITGGGLVGNVPRMLPDTLAAAISRPMLPKNPVMEFLAQEGDLSADAMEATFNCGVGMVLAVAAEHQDAVAQTLEASGETVVPIGTLVQRKHGEGCVITP